MNLKIVDGQKPAEEWTEEERRSAIDALSGYDYVPISPESVEHDEIFTSLEKRAVYLWTVRGSMEVIIREWPS